MEFENQDAQHGLLVRGPWPFIPDWLIVLGMFISVAIFYRASYQLPITALGLAMFALLALLRPRLALLYIPLTVPLFFMPKGIWDERFGIRSEGIRFPLHEVLLLVTTGAAVFRFGVAYVMPRLSKRFDSRKDAKTQSSSNVQIGLVQHAKHYALRHAPTLLFVLAGTLGVVIASPGESSEALREWRWLIVEPVLFSVLLIWLYPQQRYGEMIGSFVLGGALVGLVGILQYVGLNVVPFIGDEVGFSQDVAFVEGVFRVNSVYGHPNNLALYMGRIWPVACMLMLAAYDAIEPPSRQERQGLLRSKMGVFFYGVCCLLALGGMYVAFSKGAQLGAMAAMLVIVVFQVLRDMSRADNSSKGNKLRLSTLTWLLLLVLFAVFLATSGLRVERLHVLGASSTVRVKTWIAALEMVRDHPFFGIGLDQFLRYYPNYMDPSLVGTNEQYTSHPHNVLLDVWLRMGILGLIAFGWLVVRFYRRALWAFRLRSVRLSLSHEVYLLHVGLVAAMTAALVHGLVDNCYFVPDLAFAFWLMVAVGGRG